MKKMKMFLVLGISAMLMAGCASGSDTVNGETKEEKEEEKEIEEGIAERDIAFSKELGESYLKVNMDYYNYCKDEYKGKIRTEGDLIADNGNGIDIDAAKIREKDEMLYLSLYSNEENKDKLLDEVNKALKMNNYENMTQEEFDGVVWATGSNDSILWPEEENNTLEDTVALYKVEEGSYIEKGELVLIFSKGKDLGMYRGVSEDKNTNAINFANKDSFLKMKELSDKAFAERELGEEAAE